MKLKDFIEREGQRLKLFEQKYNEANKKKPEWFSLDMEPGEWDEQFHIFDESDLI